MNKYRKPLFFSLLVLIIAVAVMLSWFLFSTGEDVNPADVPSVQDETSENNPMIQEEEEDERQLPILVDAYDINKQLYDCPKDELTLEELTLYANITLETSGVYDMIDSAVLKDCLSSVLANSEETVYLVLRVEDEVLTINVCTYEDRVNAKYSASFALSDGKWSEVK